ncbi:hypothetical protein [Streptococcus sp. WB01_FAA12]|uniref:hypothetical protein n=1 Tax=Streptococcus sp. WB01_FAA12 TaxID=2725308 RepID=UPI00146E470C|nr:hypothetical protein [Streptococcus sp. WB01_FAA12]NMD84912.1 hypothetical protein [Streptococcus sp. WB01_FAA12]
MLYNIKIGAMVVKIFIWSLIPAMLLYLITGSFWFSFILWSLTLVSEYLAVADFKVSLESEKQNKKNIEIVEDFGKME